MERIKINDVVDSEVTEEASSKVAGGASGVPGKSVSGGGVPGSPVLKVAGGATHQEPYLKYELENVIITSYS